MPEARNKPSIRIGSRRLVVGTAVTLFCVSAKENFAVIEDRLELGARTDRMVDMILELGRPASSLHQYSVDKEVQRYMAVKCQNLADYPNHIEVS